VALNSVVTVRVVSSTSSDDEYVPRRIGSLVGTGTVPIVILEKAEKTGNEENL